MRKASVSRLSKAVRRLRLSGIPIKQMAMIPNPLVAAAQRLVDLSIGTSVPLVEAVVLIVIVVVPCPAIDAGLKLHAAPLGKPEQARLIVPPKPCRARTVNDNVPDPPGALIVTVEAPGTRAKLAADSEEAE